MRFFASLFSVLVLVLGLTACNNLVPTSEPGSFDAHGFAFTVPASWSITEEENLDDEGYYLSCERQGFDASGLLTLTWYYFPADREFLLGAFQQSLAENPIFELTDINFGPVRDTVFQEYDALKIPYRMTLLGLPHRGMLLSYYCDTYTMVILQQEAVEDIASNQDGFRTLFNTLKCTPSDSTNLIIQPDSALLHMVDSILQADADSLSTP